MRHSPSPAVDRCRISSPKYPKVAWNGEMADAHPAAKRSVNGLGFRVGLSDVPPRKTDVDLKR